MTAAANSPVYVVLGEKVHNRLVVVYVTAALLYKIAPSTKIKDCDRRFQKFEIDSVAHFCQHIYDDGLNICLFQRQGVHVLEHTIAFGRRLLDDAKTATEIVPKELWPVR
jgi:hypothetical protein